MLTCFYFSKNQFTMAFTEEYSIKRRKIPAAIARFFSFYVSLQDNKKNGQSQGFLPIYCPFFVTEEQIFCSD